MVGFVAESLTDTSRKYDAVKNADLHSFAASAYSLRKALRPLYKTG